MGVYLKWRQAFGSSYTHTYIYRSNTESGLYSELANQSYNDLNYYDPSGDNSHWYKIRFWDAVAASWSDLSDAFQGGTWIGYCNIQDIRDVTNLTVAQVSDGVLCRMISLASQCLNADVNVKIEEEQVLVIPATHGVKQNDIDGTNTMFYTANYPLGDSNDSFTVTTGDISVYEIDSSPSPSTKTKLTVTSLTPNTGQYILSTAPELNRILLVSYVTVPRSVSDPHPLVRQAAIYLASAMAYTKLNVGKARRFKMGNVTVTRDMESYKYYKSLYSAFLLKINDTAMIETQEALSIPFTGEYEINFTPPDRSISNRGIVL